jgi:hypothetical protein
MSLTSFLALPDVKARFKQEWPLSSPRPQTRSWLMVAPPISPRPQLIGTAFDYVLRFHLRRLNPLAEERENWVAESAVANLKGNIRKSGQQICETAHTRYQHFLGGEPLHDDLLASALQLAQLDFVFRAAYLPPSGEFTVFAEDIADLRQLAEVCDWSQWRALERCHLNPTFGMASHLVGGADADFHLDNTLYELKTVKTAAISLQHYHQLIGYAVLNFLDNGPPIDELAIYFSRFAQTVRWPAPSLSEHRHEPFLSWFSETADDVFNRGLSLSQSAVDSVSQPKLETKTDNFDDGNYQELETLEGYFSPYCTGCDTTFLFWWRQYLGGSDSETVNCPNCGQEFGMLETESKLLGQMKGDVGEDIFKFRPTSEE